MTSTEKEREKAEKQAERERLREQREQERRDRQNRREQAEREKEARRLQRQEERRIKEEERARREAEKRAREREREEERAKREEERRAKEREREEERARREEERRVKEEERRRREAERAREEEEKKRKTEKQRAILMGFFVPQEKPTTQSTTASDTSTAATPFMQFELKKDQRRAPVCRIESEELRQTKWKNVEALRVSWQSGSPAIDGSRLGLTKFGQPNYLHELRTGQVKPLSSAATWPVEMPDVLCSGSGMPLDNSAFLRYNHGDPGNGGTVWTKAKLFQFVENYRPAYYGTWRRRSYVIKGRRPFSKDHLQLDYEVDSDDEWEEEEPGENISQSEGEEEEDLDDDDDEDAKFLVPHGYLSDDEGVRGDEDEEGGAVARGAGDAGEAMEMKKLRQRLSLAEYETAHRRGLHKLKPLLLGPIWAKNPLGALQETSANEWVTHEMDENKENISVADPLLSAKETKTTNHISALPSKGEFDLMRSVLNAYKVCVDLLGTFLSARTPSEFKFECDVAIENPSTGSKTPASGRTKKQFPPEAIPYLIRLVHKNSLSKVKLQFEFRVFWLKHTTDEPVPNCCLSYKEYKQRPEAESAATPTGDTATPPNLRRPQAQRMQPMTTLPLSKRQTMAKICEIAVFEDGQWRVRPEVLEACKAAVLAPTGLPEASESVMPITDPCFSFPAWSYLTDVATFTNRRSLQSCQATASTTPTSPHPPPPCGNLTSPSTGTPPIAKRLATTEVSTTPPVVAKKRTTLETFFAAAPPSAKRRKDDA
ncbi:unnamed protein product [Mesocestoides corti]|uniref:Chromatin assembly factor 1 subunit p150 C-terminal domain-containing protein n=1 Tax=Mesocestoides corti TaxID=53468 RepID=A0A3P6I1Q6_MESCO|nr:unnamed protein product [Mesocestoides corti]